MKKIRKELVELIQHSSGKHGWLSVKNKAQKRTTIRGYVIRKDRNHKLAAAKEMRNAKLKLEQAKKRVSELDKLIKSVFEQRILGTLSEESYRTMIADYEKEQREVKQFILESKTEVQTAKQETADLKDFLVAIRKCTDITELTPTLVNTLIKKIEIFNSVVGPDGKKHVPITIHFRAAGIITVPDEKEIVAAMEEIRNTPSNVA